MIYKCQEILYNVCYVFMICIITRSEFESSGSIIGRASIAPTLTFDWPIQYPRALTYDRVAHKKGGM